MCVALCTTHTPAYSEFNTSQRLAGALNFRRCFCSRQCKPCAVSHTPHRIIHSTMTIPNTRSALTITPSRLLIRRVGTGVEGILLWIIRHLALKEWGITGDPSTWFSKLLRQPWATDKIKAWMHERAAAFGCPDPQLSQAENAAAIWNLIPANASGYFDDGTVNRLARLTAHCSIR